MFYLEHLSRNSCSEFIELGIESLPESNSDDNLPISEIDFRVSARILIFLERLSVGPEVNRVNISGARNIPELIARIRRDWELLRIQRITLMRRWRKKSRN